MISTTLQNKPQPPIESVGAGISGGPQSELGFKILLTQCGVYELTERGTIAVTGADRIRWLNGIITNNIRDLSPGTGVYAFVLNPQGRILGDLYAYNRGDTFQIETDRSQLQNLLDHFNRYIIMDDVEVREANEPKAIGVTGPAARKTMLAIGIEIPELQSLGFVDLIWRNHAITVVRQDHPCVQSYEIWTSSDNVEVLRRSLQEAGAQLVGRDDLELLRIASGVPQYGQDIRERDLPQETGQQRALHFSKGCYIGQEIVERIRSRGNVHRQFTGFTVEGPLPVPEHENPTGWKEIRGNHEFCLFTSGSKVISGGLGIYPAGGG